MKVEIAPDAFRQLVTMSNSDARTALNALEVAAMTTPPDADGVRRITLAVIEDAVQHRRHPLRRARRAALRHHFGFA